MEPRIQYAKTKDGVSIAYWTLGEGNPIVHLPPPITHIELEWQFPEMRHWYERLAHRRMLIRFDTRGMGLSQRDVSDLSLDRLVLDAEAVVDRLGLERFALFGYQHSGPVAVAYAARHPERVSHLILWAAYAKPSEWTDSPQVQAVRALMEKDWPTYTETLAHVVMGWSEGEPARRFAEMIREGATPELLQVGIRALLEFDVQALLPQVRTPTLVLHRRQFPFPAVSAARGLAAAMPDSRLAILEGESLAPYLGDSEAVLQAIDEFLGEREEATASETCVAGALRSILFTDVEGSTALTQRLGDARARELLREHERMVREALKAHRGSEVKTLGDGFMASFSSAIKALECAIAMQRTFAAHNESAEEPILVRVGLNAGEPIAEEDPDGRSDLFGTAVNLAARIAAKAEGGEILTSDTVRGLVAGKRFLFADRGETAMRGFEDPVRLFEVSWREESS